jgi:hypothetical protein
VSDPAKSKDPAYKRLILFPFAMFYIAVLVVSSWPPQLSPGGRVMDAIEAAANHLLAQAAIMPALNVFTVDTAGDRSATVRTCFRLLGYAYDGERTAQNPRGLKRRVLYDTFPRCANDEREVVKNPYRWFHDKHLRRGIDHLYTPGADLDRNQPPLNVLFSILDYHCHRTGPLAHVTVISHHERIDLDTGELVQRTTTEGTHQCETGRWDVVRAPYRKPIDDL